MRGGKGSSAPGSVEAVATLQAALKHTQSERDQLQARVLELERELEQVHATNASSPKLPSRAAATLNDVTRQFDLLGKALQEVCGMAGLDA